ncbi:MAG: EamA family transporter [Bacillota bacterium]
MDGGAWLWWALLASLLWGVAPMFAKLGLERTGAEAAIFLRSAVISALSGVWLGASGKIGELTSIGLKPILAIAAEGVAASLVGHFAYYKALQLGAVSKAVPVSSTYPVVAMLVSAAVIGEKLSLGKVLGTALIVAGVVLLRVF